MNKNQMISIEMLLSVTDNDDPFFIRVHSIASCTSNRNGGAVYWRSKFGFHLQDLFDPRAHGLATDINSVVSWVDVERNGSAVCQTILL